MSHLFNVYSNLADAPDIPNRHALQRLIENRTFSNSRGKLRYEHVYESSSTDLDKAEFEFVKTFDHGEVQS